MVRFVSAIPSLLADTQATFTILNQSQPHDHKRNFQHLVRFDDHQLSHARPLRLVTPTQTKSHARCRFCPCRLHHSLCHLVQCTTLSDSLTERTGYIVTFERFQLRLLRPIYSSLGPYNMVLKSMSGPSGFSSRSGRSSGDPTGDGAREAGDALYLWKLQ
ncbi:hypothetical protein CC80DRAFT_582201 [Byssothecium circinans]|uniref:Uncharacterized protein n=1 Tax=Byssothecium circinans TaxID=147558 RepID=A0A6A5T8P7_9PLEO|nr:hypothetical protein CC80DRAFT_582201 [Byssothecium circinans]